MRHRLLWPVLAVCLLFAVFLRAYPLTIIQPFKHQEADALQRALFVLRTAPLASLFAGLAAVASTALAWRNLRRGPRIAAGTMAILTCAAAVLVRVNVFELMFHPAGAPRFLPAMSAKIEPSDMLIAVTLHGDAHAYPIREMGYHHVVNDVAGGVPIVATY